MAVDIKDVEQVAQELQQKFDDFKAKNDKRVEAIEQEKGKLAGQVETLNGKLSELENLKSDLEKELLELKRPAGGAQNKLATEHKEAFVGFLRKGREDGLRDLERKALQVTADAIIKLIYTLRKAHRTGAKFMMNNNSLFAIRLLKDSEGNYLWRPGLELGQPSSLAGYGIAENEQMPDIAADAKAIAFGNFKRGYTIVDRIGTRILRDPYTNKPFVGFYTTKRTGGMLVDSQAIKLLKIAAA